MVVDVLSYGQLGQCVSAVVWHEVHGLSLRPWIDLNTIPSFLGMFTLLMAWYVSKTENYPLANSNFEAPF